LIYQSSTKQLLKQNYTHFPVFRIWTPYAIPKSDKTSFCSCVLSNSMSFGNFDQGSAQGIFRFVGAESSLTIKTNPNFGFIY